MTRRPPKDHRTSDQELWEKHRSSITPLKEKYRHTIFPVGEISIKPHQIQESQINRFYDQQLQDHSFNPRSLGYLGSMDGSTQSHQKHIKAKQVVIDARLDLHGLTRANAFDILQRFIIEAQIRKHEWILVITGKGDNKNPYTLKKLVPQWLEQIHQVSGYSSAKPHDGGSGAYYVKIRLSRL